MTVELARDELEIINNGLNEVCNGIHLAGELTRAWDAHSKKHGHF